MLYITAPYSAVNSCGFEPAVTISKDIYKDGIIVTADTDYANEANMQFLHEQKINTYIPDNKFRSRDPKFSDQKTKYGKRQQHNKKKLSPAVFPPSAFILIIAPA